jgi:hypothetical protein
LRHFSNRLGRSGMYTIKDLGDEIGHEVAWLEEHNGRTIEKRWLISKVMANHGDIQGQDAAFAVCCARFAVEQQVDRYFRTIKKDEEEGTEQQLLPGFEKLQRKYITTRNGEQLIVSIYDMTDEEIDRKAAEHRVMGQGHFKHADELERFKETRQQQPLRIDA